MDWSIPVISSEERSGTLEFTVGGDDASTFFPVKVNFVAQGSVVGVGVTSVEQTDDGRDVDYSQDISVTVDDYTVV